MTFELGAQVYFVPGTTRIFRGRVTEVNRKHKAYLVFVIKALTLEFIWTTGKIYNVSEGELVPVPALELLAMEAE